MHKRLTSVCLALIMLLGLLFVTPFTDSSDSALAAATTYENEKIVYDFLTQQVGLNAAQACGVLGNLYVESKFSPGAYNPNDSGGTTSFGICQWNSGGKRRTNLKNWCESNGYDEYSLEGQLTFMEHELLTVSGYKLSTLKSYPNTAEGAYNAALLFARYYEGCASSSWPKRAALAEELFWPEYGDKTLITEMSINPISYPKGTIPAEPFSLSGSVIGPNILTNVTGAIYTAAGKKVDSASANPHAKRYVIGGSGIDNNLKFGSLTPGSYYLKYTATDETGKTISWTSEVFNVIASDEVPPSVITIDPTAYPTGDMIAQSVSLKGTITTSESLIQVVGAICTSEDKVVQSVTVSASGASLNINKSALNSNLKFGSLTPGEYYLKYTVMDSTGHTESWQSDVFTIKASVITISMTAYPTGQFKPKAFTLKGTVKSTAKMKTVTGYIRTYDGTAVQSITVKTTAKSLSIKSSNINSKLKFKTLTEGCYYLQIDVLDSKGTSSIWKSDYFTVGNAVIPTPEEPEVPVVPDEPVVPDVPDTPVDPEQPAEEPAAVTSLITFNPRSYPTGTIAPASFNLTGSISSNLTLVSVTGSICNADDTVVQTITAQASGTTFNIINSTIDYNLKFGKLADGNYYLTYSATDNAGYSATWKSELFTVKSASNEPEPTEPVEEPATEVPEEEPVSEEPAAEEPEIPEEPTSVITFTGLNSPSGTVTPKPFTLKGTITCSAKLKTVTGSICKADGTVVQTSTVSVTSATYSIINGTIDKNLKFGNLTKGTYYLTYTVTDETGHTETWTSESWKVA